MTSRHIDKAPLQLLSERRESTLLFGQTDEVVTLDRISRGIYRENTHYEDIWQYAAATPPSVSADFVNQVDRAALAHRPEAWYETQLDTLIAAVGHVGLELVLRFTQNGARLSTLKSTADGVYGDEQYLAVTPSVYFSIIDACAEVGRRYAAQPQQDSW